MTDEPKEPDWFDEDESGATAFKVIGPDVPTEPAVGALTLHLAAPNAEAIAALYKRLTGRDDLSVEEVRAALEGKPPTQK